MDFRILGPFEATADAGPVTLTGGKQKALLALLLLHADRVVPMDRLIDDLWGDEVPETAQKMVQIFISQLRKQLPDELLRTRAPGYLVELDGHSLDLRRFEELHAGGREALAQGRAHEAAAALRGALELWRGPALAEFEEPFARVEEGRLAEQHLTCLEERIEADLILERHVELVAELDALVRRHPLRERLRGQLMLALYRCGSHAEALEASRRSAACSTTNSASSRPQVCGNWSADAAAGRVARPRTEEQVGYDRTARRAGVLIRMRPLRRP